MWVADMSPKRLMRRPATSWLHRLHPLVKLGWLLAMGIGMFVYYSPSYILILIGFILVLMLQARLDPRRDLRASGLLLWTAVFLFCLQAVFYHEGQELFNLWPFGRKRWPVTAEGVRRGVVVGGRFLAIVASSQLFALVTDPSALAYALMRAGLPYRYGFALVTALRLVPIFEAEASTVYQAQLTRGVRYDAHALRRAYELLKQFMLPMLVSALRKVDALAISMEGRHFGRYATRTFLRRSEFGGTDRLACVGLVLYVALTICLKTTS